MLALWAGESPGANRRESEVHVLEGGQPLRLAALLSQQPEREVESFDLAEPALGGRVPPPVFEIGFELVKSEGHLWVDVEHGAADAGVLVCAGRAVEGTVPRSVFLGRHDEHCRVNVDQEVC